MHYPIYIQHKYYYPIMEDKNVLDNVFAVIQTLQHQHLLCHYKGGATLKPNL